MEKITLLSFNGKNFKRILKCIVIAEKTKTGKGLKTCRVCYKLPINKYNKI